MCDKTVGINYEGGKIIEYAIHCTFCIGYINAQIAMDAPFHGQVADEKVRSEGRSELSMDGYKEEHLVSGLRKVILIVKSFISRQHNDALIIFQVARGRSARSTIQLVEPILKACNIVRYLFVTGYRSLDYFQHPEEPFVFVNIGMFGRLTNIDNVNPGDILNPIATFDLVRTCNGELQLISKAPRIHTCSKNLLSGSEFDDMMLIGIADEMPFITPNEYNAEDLYEIVRDILDEIKINDV